MNMEIVTEILAVINFMVFIGAMIVAAIDQNKGNYPRATFFLTLAVLAALGFN